MRNLAIVMLVMLVMPEVIPTEEICLRGVQPRFFRSWHSDRHGPASQTVVCADEIIAFSHEVGYYLCKQLINHTYNIPRYNATTHSNISYTQCDLQSRGHVESAAKFSLSNRPDIKISIS
jgi:hypothetical protein